MELDKPESALTQRLSRVIVVLAENPERVRDVVPAVGVVRYSVEQSPRIAVFVKTEHTLRVVEGAEVFTMETEPAKACVAQVDRPGVGVPWLDYASDFTPPKPFADVVIVGHAYARGPVSSIDGEIAFAGAHRVLFTARGAAILDKIPLVPPFLAVHGAGATEERFVAVREPGLAALGGALGEGFDFSRFNVASPLLRLPNDPLEPGWSFHARGLFPEAEEVRVVFPPLSTRVTVDSPQGEDRVVRMRLDTVRIDTDLKVVTIVERGEISHVPDDTELARVIVSLEEKGKERTPERRLADTQRGRVFFAWSEADAIKGEPPPTDDPRLESARYGTWASTAPEPRIEIDRYALISAELAERPSERERTLARHELDEDTWVVEERAWLERFASEAIQGAPNLASVYGALFVKAQDSLARPEEFRFGVTDYAFLEVKIERSGDIMSVLDDAELTLSQWMRLERRVLVMVEEDEEAATEYATAKKQAEAETPEVDALMDADDEGDSEDDET